MKIYPGPIMKPLDKTINKQPVSPAEKTHRPVEGDKVAFSKELQQAQGREKTPTTDPARNARIQDVKEQIKNNSYAPDSLKVATSLLKYIVNGTGGGK